MIFNCLYLVHMYSLNNNNNNIMQDRRFEKIENHALALIWSSLLNVYLTKIISYQVLGFINKKLTIIIKLYIYINFML